MKLISSFMVVLLFLITLIFSGCVELNNTGKATYTNSELQKYCPSWLGSCEECYYYDGETTCNTNNPSCINYKTYCTQTSNPSGSTGTSTSYGKYSTETCTNYNTACCQDPNNVEACEGISICGVKGFPKIKSGIDLKSTPTGAIINYAKVADAQGSSIIFNYGIYPSVTNSLISNIEAGYYKIDLTLNGYKDNSFIQYVRSGCTEQINQILEKSCVPNCLGKECGNNGCGGSCGNCRDGKICDNNICIKPIVSTVTLWKMSYSGYGWYNYNAAERCPNGWTEKEKGHITLPDGKHNDFRKCSTNGAYGFMELKEMSFVGSGWSNYYKPPMCPPGWSEVSVSHINVDGGAYNDIRTCIKQNCQVNYFEANSLSGYNWANYYNCARCPTGWIEAGVSHINIKNSHKDVRTCYKCA